MLSNFCTTGVFSYLFPVRLNIENSYYVARDELHIRTRGLNFFIPLLCYMSMVVDNHDSSARPVVYYHF